MKRKFMFENLKYLYTCIGQMCVCEYIFLYIYKTKYAEN